jgi:hypothetical protein
MKPMPGKKRVAQSDDLGQIRIMLEQMRSENRLTAEAVEAVGRQHSAELRAFESRMNGRFDVLEALLRLETRVSAIERRA